jgi:hypothetical protein
MQAENRDKKTIIKDHLALVRAVIDKVMKKSRSNEELALLDRLKKRITLLLQTMGEDSLLVEMTPFMILRSEEILGRNEKFFLEINAKDEYIKANGVAPPSEDEFLFLLIDSIRALYKKISQKERDDLYADVVKIFNCCVEYQIAAQERFSAQ